MKCWPNSLYTLQWNKKNGNSQTNFFPSSSSFNSSKGEDFGVHPYKKKTPAKAKKNLLHPVHSFCPFHPVGFNLQSTPWRWRRWSRLAAPRLRLGCRCPCGARQGQTGKGGGRVPEGMEKEGSLGMGLEREHQILGRRGRGRVMKGWRRARRRRGSGREEQPSWKKTCV